MELCVDVTNIIVVHILHNENGCLNLFVFRDQLFCIYSQIGSTVVKAFAFQVDGLGFNSPSGYKVGCLGHSKYVWVGQYEPSCLKFPSSVLEDKL